MSENLPAPKSLSESAVVVVGGTSGVGLAVATQFADAGVKKIALLGRNAERGEAARAKIAAISENINVVFVSADCNEPDQALRACEQARAALGGVDVLVNSTSASYVPKLLFRMDLNEITSTLTQQALAPMLTSHIVLPWMREQKSGVILNIASDAAKVPTPGETVLGAAMAAIVTFTRTLAMEAKRDGIRVNAITPSLIAGTSVYDRIMGDPFSEKLFSKAAQLASLGVAEPGDLAALIVFLSGPQAGKITGQAISVNGGISAA